MEKITPYTKQDEYDLVNSGQYCIGWTVVDQSGKSIGKVTEMLINTDTEMIDSIIVNSSKRIAASDFSLSANEQVVVRGIGETAYDETQAHTETVETETNYAAMERNADARHVAGFTREAADNEITLPVIEEQLRIGKRAVQTGEAQVHTTVQETPVEETVRLREEKVNVERRPVDRPVENAPAAFREGTIEVTEMAEVPVVGKEARVVEEVVVGKEVREREETVRDTVTRTDVEVDELNRNADPRNNR